jgi:hypothetical protein
MPTLALGTEFRMAQRVYARWQRFINRPTDYGY